MAGQGQPTQSLHSRLRHYLRRLLRTGVVMTCVLALSGTVLITLVFLYVRHLWSSEVAKRMITIQDAPFSSEARAHALTLLHGLEGVMVRMLNTLLLELLLLALAIGLVVVLAYSFAGYSLAKRLFNHPTLALILLRQDRNERRLVAKLLYIACLGLAVMILTFFVFFVLDAKDAGQSAVLIEGGLLVSAILVTYVIAQNRHQSKLATNDRAPALFVRNRVIYGVFHMGAFVAALTIFLVLSVLLAQAAVGRANEVIFVYADDVVTNYHLQIETFEGAERKWLERAAEEFKEKRAALEPMSDFGATLAERGPDIIGFWTALVIVLGILAYLDVSLTLFSRETRKPLRLLLATTLVVLILEIVSVKASDALASAQLLNMGTRFGIVLLIFAAGQASGALLPGGVERPVVCPRCAAMLVLGSRECPRCGTQLARLQAERLVGNIESHELHAESCPHCLRMLEKNRKVFRTAIDAYWEEYDNCGTCLGGSGYAKGLEHET